MKDGVCFQNIASSNLIYFILIPTWTGVRRMQDTRPSESGENLGRIEGRQRATTILVDKM